jgi:hypothetical protein
MHNPEQAATELAEKLASRNRHVMFLLAAGASCAAGLPDLNGLKNAVEGKLAGADQTKYRELGKLRNIEEILSRLRLIAEVLSGTADELDGLTATAAADLDKVICSAISDVIKTTTTNLEAHLRFSRWCARSPYNRPLEIFTTNYDNLIEKSLEQIAAPYFDGFVGNHEGVFRADLVDSTDGRDQLTPPQGWIRLWKLHGSISWSQTIRAGSSATIRSSAPGTSLAIYPSLQKYEESRRIPFVVLADRLRRALAIPETICVVAGYSFGDEHINDFLYDAAQYYPASEVLVLCFSDILPALAERAKATSNLTVVSPTKAVIGGKEANWQAPAADTPFWKGAAFSLGDFSTFSEFLLINARAGSAPLLPGGVAP